MLFATIGCSFTRGERLFYHRYVEDDELLDPKHGCNQDLSLSPLQRLLQQRMGPGNPLRKSIPIFGQIPDRDGNHMAVATKQDKRFMLDISYTGLLSKRLNCEYFTKSGSNFGNIDDTLLRWVEISRTVPERKLDFIVLQLTDPQRDIGVRDKKGDPDIGVFWDKLRSISTPPEEKKKLLHHIEVEIPEQMVSKVLEVNKLCKDNDIDLLVWSWQDELAEMLKDEDFFVPIIYDGKSYISYDDMREHYSVGFDQIFDSNDTHPNKFFNRVLFDSIIIKLKEKGII